MWRALQMAFLLSVAGALFYGVLSYQELFGAGVATPSEA